MKKTLKFKPKIVEKVEKTLLNVANKINIKSSGEEIKLVKIKKQNLTPSYSI